MTRLCTSPRHARVQSRAKAEATEVGLGSLGRAEVVEEEDGSKDPARRGSMSDSARLFIDNNGLNVHVGDTARNAEVAGDTQSHQTDTDRSLTKVARSAKP